MSQISVGVLRGGPSSEYEVSLNSGKEVLSSLNREKYKPVDIFIDRGGLWHLQGLAIKPFQAAKQVDVFWNGLHGEYGEDGTVQNILESLKKPYTGSKNFASAICINKDLTKKYLVDYNIKFPKHFIAREDDNVDELAGFIFYKMSPPWIVKPANKGSSVGLYIAYTISDLAKAIQNCLEFTDKVLIEEYIIGKEATCGVVENFRNKDLYSLPVIEIRKPKDRKLFDYDAKYSGITEEICPGCFLSAEKNEIEESAKAVHRALGLRHYSRSDFIVNKRGVYLLEANSLPGLTKESLLPKALKAVGCSYDHFLDHVIELALNEA